MGEMLSTASKRFSSLFKNGHIQYLDGSSGVQPRKEYSSAAMGTKSGMANVNFFRKMRFVVKMFKTSKSPKIPTEQAEFRKWCHNL
ncbi:MAG: hypothetical protein ABS44_11120 [Chryseobacterium sp. SCN 40-13]|nr:MAG: hypothetical protein ABS44_11120 [Chryseobacterium sp. SCN 40-13]